MKRRGFLSACLASLVAFLWPEPAERLRKVWRLENGRWVRVRMIRLRKGDRFRHEDWPHYTFVAESDGSAHPTGTATVQARADILDLIDSWPT